MTDDLPKSLTIRVRGQVQGVGFRPFIWRLAHEHGLRGRVWNDAGGVTIEAAGDGLAAFIAGIIPRAPHLARIDNVDVAPFAGPLPDSFVIAPSRGGGVATGVTPDAATCADCLAEIRGSGRRRGYAFTNCTLCGPRFTILHGVPYDRAQTTMARFTMCPACAAEYGNPADRRFHAQPIACPTCGPRLWLEVAGGEHPGDPLAVAARVLQAGQIVAIKGLGGFHLACDATNPAAVALLRHRKHRPTKPLALMATEADLHRVAALTDADRTLLASPAAPIVLVQSRGVLPDGVAPGMATLGVMLPSTPLHHLLLDAFAGVLVMTSGNLSGEPQVVGNDEARAKLALIADAFLLHDRDIARRLDDSVERATPPMILRRGRGRVPGTIPLPAGFEGAPQVLALGGQIKGAICLLKEGRALLGHHLGDLGNTLVADEFDKALADYRALFDHRPALVAVDAHSGYRATQAGMAMGLPLARVFHHHAHLAACLAENGWPIDGGKVAGIILDGTGLGADGTIWGGELLLADYTHFERRHWLLPAALPGGDRAAREPWRNALMRLDQAGLGDWADTLFADKPRDLLRQSVAKGINAPLSSSAGRLFDAVAAVLGVCADVQTYEGEAAMRLECLAATAAGSATTFPPVGNAFDPAPWFADLKAALPRTSAAQAAANFHASLARTFATEARRLVEGGHAQAVALSGGCFQNAVLLRETLGWLDGIRVLTHRSVAANDGGLALGQAMVAAAWAMTAAENP